MTVQRRTLIVLHPPRRHGTLVTFARAVVQGLTSNPSLFPKPSPPVAQLNTAIDALQEAETAAHSRTRGTRPVRDEKRAALLVLLEQLRGYVQQVADAHADSAQSIAESAGLTVRKAAVRHVAPLSVKAGGISGTARLVARRLARRASNEWQYSTDGKTWTSAPPTLQCRTTITGLQPGVLTYFRHRAVTKDGPTEWSQLVSLIVQ